MKRFQLVGLLLPALLAGSATIGGSQFFAADVSTFKIGQTNMDDVFVKLGST